MHDDLMNLTRRQKRMMKNRLKELAKELAAGIGCGLLLGAMLIAGFYFDDYEPPSAPEHFGQIEYCGVWWDVEDYEQMMAEREAYLKAEQESEQAFIQSVMDAQNRVQTGQSIQLSMDFDSEDAYMLARIAMAEAEGEDTEGKALVILTVLNRVASDKFPDTIEEVITQEGAFTSYWNGRYDRVEPNEDCYRALEMVQVQHWDESHGALYFERTTDEDTWHNTHLKELFKHGNHTFHTFYTEK
jgi:spore germination cell wall hydrolase CwlJ-like protein